MHSEKMKSSIKDLITFTEEIFIGKLHFLCSDPSRFAKVVLRSFTVNCLSY